MNTKILIDVNAQGAPVISIERKPTAPIEDVRDKLVNRFLESGQFAAMKYEEDNQRITIEPMTVRAVLQLIADWYGEGLDENYNRELSESLSKVSKLLKDRFGI